MRKSKGYAKGGAKMMKAMGGRMASKGGKKMMGAMKGKMASKGYAKGGAKMLKARVGRAITGDRRPNKVIAKKKVGTVGRAITGDIRPGKMAGITLGKFTANDIKVGNKMMNAGILSKIGFNKLMKASQSVDKKSRIKASKPVSRLTKEGKKLVKNKN